MAVLEMPLPFEELETSHKVGNAAVIPLEAYEQPAKSWQEELGVGEDVAAMFAELPTVRELSKTAGEIFAAVSDSEWEAFRAHQRQNGGQTTEEQRARFSEIDQAHVQRFAYPDALRKLEDKGQEVVRKLKEYMTPGYYAVGGNIYEYFMGTNPNGEQTPMLARLEALDDGEAGVQGTYFYGRSYERLVFECIGGYISPRVVDGVPAGQKDYLMLLQDILTSE